MSTLTGLRDALTTARPVMTGEQQDAADALLVALTPRMDEPTWPGAVVMAACVEHTKPAMHVRRHADYSAWECRAYGASRWETLNDPRPLTPAERRKHGIPGECDKHHAEPITDELVERCIEASVPRLGVAARGTFMYPAWVRAVLRAAGHPEADR